MKTLPTPALLVVIHVLDPDQAAGQTKLAIASGADGVLLIDHNARGTVVLENCLRRVRLQLGDEPWVGINPLGLTAGRAIALACELFGRGLKVDGLWVDDAGIDERTDVPDGRGVKGPAGLLNRLHGYGIAYFGGVAFKYQRKVDDLERAADLASRGLMDYICTSGPGTGQAVDVEKLKRISAGSRGHPIALASGVSVDNVGDVLPYIDAALVATSVAATFHFLDPDKVQALATKFKAARWCYGCCLEHLDGRVKTGLCPSCWALEEADNP